jgi:hypothetical protein
MRGRHVGVSFALSKLLKCFDVSIETSGVVHSRNTNTQPCQSLGALWI